MGWLDRVPRAGNLYIGGMFALRRTEAVKEAQITHVVSVIRLPLDPELFKPFKHLAIEVDDDEDENLLEHFPASNRFIEDGLEQGGGVFVHCAMGKSRSATCVIAHLMHKYRISPDEALEQVREGRGVCEPNPGFMEQLEIYHRMQAPDEVEENPIYQRWLYDRALAVRRACQQAPEIDRIRFEDEVNTGESTGDPLFELKCRKCRRTLATSQYLVQHVPKRVTAMSKSISTSPAPPSACAHYFVDALSWMRPELEQGKLDGRLECPKCKTNVGKYAWQGMQCSCGDWIVPGISLAKSRIDEVKSRTAIENVGPDIRLPPGAKAGRGPGQGNL